MTVQTIDTREQIIESAFACFRRHGLDKTTVVDIARTAYLDIGALPADQEPGLEAHSRYAPQERFTWSNACHMCTCEVDPATGSVTILRYVVSADPFMRLTVAAAFPRKWLVAVNAAAELVLFYIIFVVNNVYDPVTDELLRALRMLPR